MPSTLSTLRDKIYGREWSFPYNCYEVGHGWTPYCSGAAVEVGASAFKNALPLYTSLYLFTQLGLQRRYDPKAFGETFKSILTSCSFLSFNLLSGMALSCILRNNSDRYYYRIQCILPGFIASYMSLLIERPSRRPALAFYLANMSSELLFKWIVNEGYMVPVPHGETVLFAIGMACWLHYVRVHGFSHDPVSTALKFLIGPLEAKSRRRTKPSPSGGPLTGANGSSQQAAVMRGGELAMETDESQEINAQLLSQAENHETTSTIATIEGSGRHKKSKGKLAAMDENINHFLNQYFGCYHVCPHKGVSCLNYTLTPTITRFIWGYLGRSAMNLLPRARLLLKHPGQAFREALTAQSSINFGLFLGTFVGASRACHCILRRATGEQQVWHSSVAGGVSGLSMLFSPKSTLSTYVIWKCLEQYFFLAAERGQIKRVNEIIGLIYAVSVNVLLYIFALEPRFIRPSYMKFIDKISDHKLHQVNRMGEYCH